MKFNYLTLFGFFLGAFSLIWMGIAISESLSICNFLIKGHKTIGVVDSTYFISNTDGDARMYIIKTRLNGKLYYFKNHMQLDDHRYKIGDEVPILYIDKGPEFKIDSFKEIYLGLIISIIVSMIIIIIAVIFIRGQNFLQKFAKRFGESSIP